MPYKFDKEKIKLPEQYDKRIRIPKAEHENVNKRYKDGESLRQLGRAYGVDKGTIAFILHPERMKLYRANRNWRKYHDRKRLTQLTREIRRRKANILKVKGSKFNTSITN